MDKVIILQTSNFAFGIFKKINEDKENVFLSPFSINVALSMLSSGANGNSRQELINSLYLNEFKDQNQINKAYKDVIKVLSESTGCTLSLANRLYVSENFQVKPDFKSNLQNNYKSDAISVNFSNGNAEKEMNAWVAKKTKNLIKDVFAPNSFDDLTKLVLVNAIYFKGQWLKKFSKKSGRQPFFLSNGEIKEVQMMGKKENFKHVEDQELDCQMLELLYKRERLAMYVVLPKKRDINGLKKTLTAEKFESMRSSMVKRKVDVEMPIFKMRFRSSLVPVLNELNVSNLFNENKADLSGMSSKEGLYVSEVVHEAYVSVDENGTEAAAVTYTASRARCLDISKHFYANHPFIFIIYDTKTNTIFFIGTLDDPTKQI